MTDHDTLELYPNENLRGWRTQEDITNAIDDASDQDRSTVLTEDGKPVAAIVPIEVLEYYEALPHIRRVWENTTARS